MDLIQVILSLIGVIGLIIMLIYAMRKLTKRVSVIGGNRLKVLDRISVGRDGMLLVVSVSGKLMVVGATPNHIEKICDIDISEEEYTAPQSNQPAEGSFLAALSTVIANKKNGKTDETDKPFREDGTDNDKDVH